LYRSRASLVKKRGATGVLFALADRASGLAQPALFA
jgi:hypothetical protein